MERLLLILELLRSMQPMVEELQLDRTLTLIIPWYLVDDLNVDGGTGGG